MDITILSFVLIFILVGLTFFAMHLASKFTELEFPMDIIVARRICRLQNIKNKKECKIKELKFVKNKDNEDVVTRKVQSLRLEILIIEGEMLKLANYGKN